jgi:probable HAF family extracellular repeat protein
MRKTLLVLTSALVLGNSFGAHAQNHVVPTYPLLPGSSINPTGFTPPDISGLSRYAVTDLGTLDGTVGDSTASAINKFGQIVGESNTPYVEVPAFLYSGGHMYDITPFAPNAADALGINDRGEVVGWIQDDDTNFTLHGFVYEGGQTYDLLPLGIARAVAINNSGEIVGENLSNNVVVFRYKDGQIHILATLGTSSSNLYSTVGFNNRGQVADTEFARNNSSGYHAFLYSGSQSRDLGTLGSDSGLNSSAVGINDHGQVVGSSEVVPNVTHAFLYSGAKMQDLGTLGGTNSYALGINNLGEVVGSFDIAGSYMSHGFVYIGGRTFDLNNLLAANPVGWIITEADGVNEAGQIAATGVLTGGPEHALLLTPVGR